MADEEAVFFDEWDDIGDGGDGDEFEEFLEVEVIGGAGADEGVAEFEADACGAEVGGAAAAFGIDDGDGVGAAVG